MYERVGRKSPYHPTFYGKMRGLFKKGRGGENKPFLAYDITSKVTHQSLVTLEFVADSVSFIESKWVPVIMHRSCHCTRVYRTYGRIVETLMEDITVLNGGGLLTVTVQNTGYITGDYSVSVYMKISTTLSVLCVCLSCAGWSGRL